MQNLNYSKDIPKKCIYNAFELQIITLDSGSGTYLKGASYQLQAYNGSVFNAKSDSHGHTSFFNLSVGSYTLMQAAPPPGYQPLPYCWKIQVDNLGYIWIDGMEKNRLNVSNVLHS